MALAMILLGGCPSTSSGDGSTSDGSTGSTTQANAVTTSSSTATTQADPGESSSTGTTTGSSTSAASSGDGSSSTTSDETLEPGRDVTIVAFEDAHAFWLGWEDGQNARELDVDVEFPPADVGYGDIALYLDLACPNDACDWWDRFGTLGIVEGAGTENERVIEIARFITPYRVGGSWGIDVSALRPLLTDARTLRLHIDTWVGPGHANGDGWLVSARFEMFGGVPSPRPVEVVPVWTRDDVEIGCPDCDVTTSVPAMTLSLPAELARVELMSFITGHGQGNANNCAEFCQLEHGFLAGDTPIQRTVWRDDCDQNTIQGQQGTWTLPRAGWCPGDDVEAWVADITPPRGQRELDISYGLSDYENSCHPEAPVCEGCALGTGCEFDGGNHTAPNIKLSALAIIYAD